MTRTSQLDFGSGPDADPAYQWDRQRKLFSLAEGCTPPRAVLLCIAIDIKFGRPVDVVAFCFVQKCLQKGH